METHFINGNEFASFEDLRNRLKQFQDQHNLEIHGTTKQVTKMLYEKEEIYCLNPLPIDPITGEIKRYVGFKEEFRKVTSDCLISFKGNITCYNKPKQEQLQLFNIELPQGNIKRDLGNYLSLKSSYIFPLLTPEIRAFQIVDFYLKSTLCVQHPTIFIK